MKSESLESAKPSSEVKIYSGMAYLNDHNIEKFVSKGQHFIMFYAPWCKASQVVPDIIVKPKLGDKPCHNSYQKNIKQNHFFGSQLKLDVRLAPKWAELAVQYAHNEYIQIGRVSCMENEITCENFNIRQYPFLLWIVNGRIMGRAEDDTFEELKSYVEKMLLTENHDPDKFMKKKKALPVARISEETFETFLEKDLVFINYFAPWCAHCMQLNPLWIKLGEKFQNESRVIIADIDCIRSKAICETEKINRLPTLILYKNKIVVNVDHGGRPLESLITLVDEHLSINNLQGSTDTLSSEENVLQEKTPTKDEL